MKKPADRVGTTKGGRSLRDVRIGTKLGLLVGVGVVGMAVVAGVGINGLSSVDARTQQISGVATSLQHIAELRDAEGDMRVAVHDLSAAQTPGQARTAAAVLPDTDAAVDKDLAALTASAGSSDPASRTDLADFTTALHTWRSVRDSQLIPLAGTGASVGAMSAAKAHLATADDAFAVPLDAFVARTTGKVRPATESAASAFTSSRSLMLVTLLISAGLALALALMVGRSIVRPLRKVSAVLGGLAGGDLTGRVDNPAQDELGQMATALDTATAAMRTTVTSLAEGADDLAGSARELTATNDGIAASAEQTAERALEAAASADEVSRNVQSVAAGAEQLGASIREIAQSAVEAARVARSAVDVAQQTNDTVARLGASSDQISAVLQTISGIAEQTNLLALNATIEAARA